MKMSDTDKTTDGASESKFKTMSLSECGKYDMENKLAEKLTGWGKICKDRASKGLRKRKRK